MGAEGSLGALVVGQSCAAKLLEALPGSWLVRGVDGSRGHAGARALAGVRR